MEPSSEPGARPSDIARGAWLPVLLFLATLAIYIPTAAKEHVNTDSYAASVSAWRIAATGRPWMDSVDVSQLEGSPIKDAWLVRGAHGHLVHNRTPAVVLSPVPFYWGFNRDTDPAEFRIWVGGLTAAILVAGAGTLLLLALRRLVSLPTALASVAVFQFATPVWSVGANAIWTHSVTLLSLAGASWALLRHRWLAAGLFLGVGILARPHLAIIAAVVGLGVSWTRRDWRVAVLVGVPSAGFVGLLTAWNRMVFGEWSIQGGYGDYVIENLGGRSNGGIQSVAADYAGFLVSPDRGFLVWSPIVVLLLPALVRSWRTLPDWVRWLAVGGVVYSVAQLQINDFTGGDGYYGYRHPLELLICLTPALTLSFQSTGRVVRHLLGPVVGLQFIAIALGSTVDGFFVPIGDAWLDNSFWLALRTQPLVVGGAAVLLITAGSIISLYAVRASEHRPSVPAGQS